MQSSERRGLFFYLGVMDRADLRQAPRFRPLYFSTIAANSCAMENLLPKFKLNLFR